MGAWLLLAPPAQGTVREWLMSGAGLDPAALRSAPSVRLAGLGATELGVRDEANELNMRDFGRNVAGLLEDSDGWVIESWYGGNRHQADVSDLSNHHSYGQGGAQIIYRNERTALGADYNWTYYESKDSPGDWARVRGPLSSAMVNRRMGRFVLGAVIGAESENESRNSPDYFSIRHKQSRWIGQFGAQTDLGAARLGVAWDFERGDVAGKSVDPSRFHEDEMTWVRPVDRFSLVALFGHGPAFEGGLRVRFLDRTGGETEIVSWSAASPLNPSKELYRRTEVTTFREEESDMDVTGRLHLQVSGVDLGAEASYRAWEWTVVEGLNYKGSNREGEWTSDRLRGALGASTTLVSGRLLAAVQGEALVEDWEEASGLGASSGQAVQLLGGLGAEYFLNQTVALRGGLWLTSEDGDVDAPATLVTGHGLSGGFSWLPRGGTTQIHGSIRHTIAEPEKSEGALAAERDETSFLVGLRLML